MMHNWISLNHSSVQMVWCMIKIGRGACELSVSCTTLVVLMNALFLLAMAGWFSHRDKRVFRNLFAESFRKSVCLLDANRVALQQASNTYLAQYMCLPVRHSIPLISDHSIFQRRMVNGRLCLRWMSAKLPDDSSPMSPCRPSSRDHENDEYLFIEFSFWDNIRTVSLH